MRTRAGVEIELYLIRHGMTKGNSEHRYVGITEEHLTEEGIETLKKMELPTMDYVFVSPRVRCIETAQILFPDKDYEIIEDFQEMNFGDYEMKNYEDLKDEPYYQEWIDSMGIKAFPNGECQEEFIARSMRGLDSLLDKLQGIKEPVKVAAVVHGGTIMAVFSQLLGGNYFDYQMKNGAYMKL